MKKVIISGGGTGGHIFPAIAIANTLKKKFPDIDILFIGAVGKMEMEKVPAAGYVIKGLPIRGFQRKLSFSNFLLPWKIAKSLFLAYRIIKKFQPEVVIGVGGYASGPTLQMATMLKIPTLIQEQNSFAGKTNKLLGDKVAKVCVAYEGMEKFFPKEKIVFTGNPVREEMVNIKDKRVEAFSFFKLDSSKKTILVIGGSLGAQSLNNCLKTKLKIFQEKQVQLIWQTGKTQFESLKVELKNTNLDGIVFTQFISRMDFAYACADLVVSRAGAIAVSELTLVEKPAILIPSPNVAEDHQTKNALALSSKDAAILIPDIEGQEKLVPTMLDTIQNQELLNNLSKNIKEMAAPSAAEKIVETIVSLVK